ncbi:MAG: PTS ascorbate transporter subunit IIC [Solobacterium sp.]|nr:PTS ascorbate transporter subunit IIC [Solobacterium sp.]
MPTKDKKQIPLRLSNELYAELMRWADAEFRSVNGQIEFLLTECVKEYKKTGKRIPDIIKENKED